MKTCTHCKTEKSVTKFRKTKKTVDGYYPFCKACGYAHRFMNRQSPERVVKDLFIDIMELAFAERNGTKVYFNKTMFMEFMLSWQEFQELYKQWYKAEYNTKRMGIRLIKTLPQGTYSLDNVTLFIRDCYENEDLDILRVAPTRPTNHR